MKTERMVLLVTPEEKARIGCEAAKLGVSASEFVRQAATALDAEDLQKLPELEALMPAFEEALDRIGQNIERAIKTLEAGEARREHYRSDEYRNQVRDQYLADPDIDWTALRRVFGRAVAEAAE